MLASINPLGERGRNQHYSITVTAYIVSSTLAAAALGGALGFAGGAFADRRFALIAIAMLGAAGLACDAHWFALRVPGPARQVDENWLPRYRGWVYGSGFGAQLGLGFTTIVTASATWVAFACALLSGSGAGGIIVGTTFGLVRALPILATARVHDPARLRARFRSLEALRPRVTVAAAAAQTSVVAFAVGAAVMG